MLISLSSFAMVFDTNRKKTGAEFLSLYKRSVLTPFYQPFTHFLHRKHLSVASINKANSYEK